MDNGEMSGKQFRAKMHKQRQKEEKHNAKIRKQKKEMVSK